MTSTDIPAAARSARIHALVPCAGVGLRAQAGMPKQYASVAGQVMVERTLRALLKVRRIDTLLVVLAPGDAQFACCVGADVLARLSVAAVGHGTRAGTVSAGLVALRELGAAVDDWVLVHDAARCLVEPAMVDALIDACLPDAVGGLLAVPLTDTLKASSDGRVTATIDRSDKWLAQTPQMFRLGMLQRALSAAGDGVTDEASAIERLGLLPLLVMGDPMNLKVTWPHERALAEQWMQAR